MGDRATEPGAAALPAPYAAFLDRFGRGEYWAAHEVLEGAWREERSGFYKGLILLASAFVHVARGNGRGVAAQLGKAERALAPYAPAYLGQDVDALLDMLRRGQRLAGEHAGASPAEWRELFRAPDLSPDAALFRGTESEV